MKYSQWNVRDLGDNSCVFNITNFDENDLFNYLYTIQQYILQLGLGDYTVFSYSVIEYWNSTEKDLDILTDFPYSYFSSLNPDWNGAIEIIL